MRKLHSNCEMKSHIKNLFYTKFLFSLLGLVGAKQEKLILGILFFLNKKGINGKFKCAIV